MLRHAILVCWTNFRACFFSLFLQKLSALYLSPKLSILVYHLSTTLVRVFAQRQSQLEKLAQTSSVNFQLVSSTISGFVAPLKRRLSVSGNCAMAGR